MSHGGGHSDDSAPITESYYSKEQPNQEGDVTTASIYTFTTIT